MTVAEQDSSCIKTAAPSFSLVVHLNACSYPKGFPQADAHQWC